MIRSWLLAVGLVLGLATAASAQQVLRVPEDVGSLQQAVSQIGNGGIIEVAGGIYPAPSRGFRIRNTRRAFTIRAAAGEEVVLDGQDAGPVLVFENSDPSQGRTVAFERLTFRNGRSSSVAQAGGVTLTRADARFVGCEFEDNASDDTGGGSLVSDRSHARFVDCRWSGNSAQRRGGGLSVELSSAEVVRSRFEANVTNLPNHSRTAPGGGMYVLDSTVEVIDTSFEGNEAGWVGGGLYAFGTWSDPLGVPACDVLISGSTFASNRAAHHPCCETPGPTFGGAIHAEDHTTMRIHASQFLGNEAEQGGAVDSYRAVVEVYDSIFRGNRATRTDGLAVGGALLVTSADFNDPSTDFGAVNRRSGELLIVRSLFQGRFGEVSTTADSGGCVAVSGDTTRRYGELGVPRAGDLADNRARAVVRDSLFFDCDVDPAANFGGGAGGAIATELTDLTVEDSSILLSDAASGGGLSAIHESLAKLTGVTFARNTAEQSGGAFFLGGSEVQATGCNFLENEVSPGVSETAAQSLGAAILIRPFFGGTRPEADATGEVTDSVFSDNVGMAIRDIDSDDGPVNDVRYIDNRFYGKTFGGDIYSHTPAQRNGLGATELNAFVVNRGNGSKTDKGSGNSRAFSSIPAGALTAAPSLLPDPPSVGNGAAVKSSFVAYAWSGRNARLDGEPLSKTVGLREVTGAGSFELRVSNVTVGTARVRSGRGFFVSRRYPEFRFKVEIFANGQRIFGSEEPECIDETVCVSGALAGRSELFLRLIGPRPNGFLHAQLVRFTPSRVDVEIEQLASGTRRTYRLASLPRTSDDLTGLVDRTAFHPLASHAAVRAEGPGNEPELVVLSSSSEPAAEALFTLLGARDGAGRAGAGFFTSPAFPGFRFKVTISNSQGSLVGTPEPACIDETVCVSGALTGRSELFLRLIGPRPNGFLQTQLVRFTTSRVEVEVEQVATGARQTYVLDEIPRTSDDLGGLVDREAFVS